MDYLLILLLFFITMVLTAVEEIQKRYYLFGKIIAIINLVCVPLFFAGGGAVRQTGAGYC